MKLFGLIQPSPLQAVHMYIPVVWLIGLYTTTVVYKTAWVKLILFQNTNCLSTVKPCITCYNQCGQVGRELV